MTEQQILDLIILNNDDQLDDAIKYLDQYLHVNDLANPNVEKLTDLIEEYEERTNILDEETWHLVAQKSLEKCSEENEEKTDERE